MKFLAVNAVLPGRRVDNDEHIARVVGANTDHMGERRARQLGQMVGMLFGQSGSQHRYVRAEGETALDLTQRAGEAAIAAAGVAPDSIDLLIYVGVGRGFLEPATASIFVDRLGLRRATGFDLLDACASWLRALHIAKALLDSGMHRRILILNGEFNYHEYLTYRFDSPADLRHGFAQFTVGEAASATIVEQGGEASEYHASFRTDGALRNLCMIPLPNVAQFNGETPEPARPLQFFSDSRALLDEGVAHLVRHYAEDPAFAGFVPDIILGHAASDVASLRTARESGLDESLVYLLHGRYGNVVSASVPLAIRSALDEGRLRPGDRVLIAVASAGLSTALARMRFLMP